MTQRDWQKDMEMYNQIQEVKKILKSAMPGPSWVVDEFLQPLIDRLETTEKQAEARTVDEWHEDFGDVLWWTFPVNEPPYCGSPMDMDWPDYHTHWTPIVTPLAPAHKEGSS